MIEPIDDRQRREVLQRTWHFIDEAEAIFARRFRRIPVRFDLSGRTAGMFRAAAGLREIRYNPWIFAKYYRENLHETVPHEVAHYIVHEVFPRRSTQPHGEEWRNLMTCFGIDPQVTFQRDLEGVPGRRQRRHPYRCSCRQHDLSTTRHNRVCRGTGQYLCRYCDGPLVYAG